MYNIHTHYENIFNYLRKIIADPRVLYLYPYGSTQPEQLERLSTPVQEWPRGNRGPLILFYDQEPILGSYNHNLFDHVVTSHFKGKDFVLVTTEKDSDPLDQIVNKYNCRTAYYFHHAFAAADWFRGEQYNPLLIPPKERKINKTFITFNRITSNARVYRSLLIAELHSHNLLEKGYVSYEHTCPDNKENYVYNITQATNNRLITKDYAEHAIDVIDHIPSPIRIDYTEEEHIPNHSFALSATEQTQKSFVYLVTETCFWERKAHLTEKVFKPIVSKMPFIITGPAHSLTYLKSYGFKTFSPIIDESYDNIQDPIARLQAVMDSIKQLSTLSTHELEELLGELTPILEHNYNLFYSREFLNTCWEELTSNLEKALKHDIWNDLTR